jgi:hypothetical protein
VKGLTVKQPLAWAVARGFKDVHLSKELSDYRGRVAIQAGVHLGDAADFRLVDEHSPEVMPNLGLPGCPTELALEAVVAVVTLQSGHFHSDCNGMCSPWAAPGFPAHHLLTDARVLKRPVPVKGKPGGKAGLWTPDEDTVARIWAQLA